MPCLAISASASASVSSGRMVIGFDDHAALIALDLAHLRGLIGGRQISVNDADAAGLRHGDGEPRLGHRVHRRGDDRQMQPMSRVSRVDTSTAEG